MNDLETLKRMLDRAGIKYDVKKFDQPVMSCEKAELRVSVLISVERGYFGFQTVYEFDQNGDLVDTGAYE